MSLNLFVGRARELQRYQEFLTKENPWVLIIRGLGGSGKSTFLSELEKQTPRDTCVVTLDFAQKTLRQDYLTFLEEVSRQVAPYCDSDRVTDFKNSVRDERLNIARRVTDGSANNAQIINVGAGSEARDIDLTIDNRLVEARRQAREIAKEKFYAQMRTFALRRLVIMMDTCEWLNEETKEAEAARWAGTELIEGLRSRMQAQSSSCYVVMMSRLDLQLEGINDRNIDRLRMEMLSKTEVNDYLEDLEIQDPKVQDYIYNMTDGHPHSIAIVCDICQKQWDRPLNAADLPVLQGLFNDRAWKDIFEKDILGPLLKSPLDSLTRYGVIFRRFNLPLLQAVFTDWFPEQEASKRFNQLVIQPHVESLGNHHYVFYRLMREIYVDYIKNVEPSRWNYYHHLALDFLKKIAAPDWYYHQLACDELEGLAHWNKVKTSEPQDYIDTLREIARDKTLKLTLATLQSMGLHREAVESIA